jgi:hypothetical protein
MPAPIIRQSRLQLEPLPRKPDIHHRRILIDVSGRPERRENNVPHPVSVCVGHPGRAHQVIDLDEVDDRRRRDIVDHGDRRVVQPDIFALRLTGGVEFGDDMVVRIVGVEDRGRRGGRGLDVRAGREAAVGDITSDSASAGGKGPAMTYQYDSEARLAKATQTAATGNVATYVYDAGGVIDDDGACVTNLMHCHRKWSP